MCDQCADGLSVSDSRRGFLRASGLLALGACLPGVAGLSSAAHAQSPAVNGDEALKRLVEGNARYVAGQLSERDFSAGRAARAASQSPFASIVSCADSRVAPELAFDQGPGQLFVTRVAGNFVNKDTLASLEFGAQVLGSQLILVLGHTSCGAISATIDVVKNKTRLPGHLPALVEAIRPAVLTAQKEKPQDMLEAATIANVRLNVERLKKATPILSKRFAEKKLVVVGGVYDLATGKVNLV